MKVKDKVKDQVKGGGGGIPKAEAGKPELKHCQKKKRKKKQP